MNTDPTHPFLSAPHKSLDLAQMCFEGRSVEHHDRSIMSEAFAQLANPDLPEQLSFESRIGHRALGIRGGSWQCQDVLIYLPGWGGTFESPITQLETDYLAAELPDTTDVIRVNLPGHGEAFRSSRWPRPVMKAIKQGDFFPAGEYIANFLDTEISNREKLSIAGTSFGGRIAIALANALSRPIDTLTVFDPPGSRRQTFKEFMQTYTQKEGAAARMYGEASPDTRLRELTASSRRHGTAARLARLMRGTLHQYYYCEPAGMAAGTLRHELMTADFHNLRRLAVISPNNSYLNSVHAVNDTLATLHDAQDFLPQNQRTKIEHWTFPGTHAITRYSSNMLGLIYGSVLRYESA